MFFLFFFSLAIQARAQVSPLAGFYEIAPHKNLAIDYESKGILEGKIRVYVSGDTAVAILDQHFAGQAVTAKTEIKQVEIHLPEGIYSYDLNTGRGRKMENRRYLLKKKLAKLSKADRDYFAGYLENVRGHMVSRLIGPDDKPKRIDFLGRPAFRYELSTGAILTLWNGIVVQMDVPSANLHLVATKIDLKFAVPDSLFNPVRGSPAVLDSAASAALTKQVDQIIEAVRTRKLGSYLATDRGRR